MQNHETGRVRYDSPLSSASPWNEFSELTFDRNSICQWMRETITHSAHLKFVKRARNKFVFHKILLN